MAKYDIQVNADNCTGCLRCQLACSDLYQKKFNPASARVQVTFSEQDECAIFFTDDCIHCGICVDHCFYDAMLKTKKEVDG